MSYSLRQKLGAIAYDLPQFLWSMRPSPRHPWVHIRNRDEHLVPDENGIGVECNWQWTSDLHVPKVFPSLGRRLMRRALDDWPIEFGFKPRRGQEPVQISFIIGHRGADRLPLLLLTLQSIASQRGASVECIVVEQSAKPEARMHLPTWVRYVHTPLPQSDMPYNRAWAFNVGAREASGDILVLQDGDILVPREYGAQLLPLFGEGYEVVNLKRFIFFLAEAKWAACFVEMMLDEAPESIMQNALGGSIAVTRSAYFEIGGFDESFVGWGGEDNEFWSRARTRRVWPYGYLPLVHLWHPTQPGKFSDERATAKLFERRSEIPAEERIRELTSRDFGKVPS